MKHRFMSVGFLFQRGAAYAVATIIIILIFSLAAIFSEMVLQPLIGYWYIMVTALVALALAILYAPLVRGFERVTDRLFFRGRYDYQKILRKISHEIASVIKLEQLARLVAVSCLETMKLSEVSFLLPDKEGGRFRSIPLSVQRYKKLELDLDNPIVAWLNNARDILARDEVRVAEVAAALDRLGIPVWVPIIGKNRMIGIIALGGKLSGDAFTPEDLGLLTTLANQTAVALDNARLYDEVVTMKNYSEEILQSMTNGVLTTDAKGRIVTYNSMAERITGRKLGEVIGKTSEELWGKRGTITQAVEQTFKERSYLNYETGISSPERGLVPVAISTTLLRDSQGKKTGALLSIHDRSELKELEDKIRRADKLTALATMAAGMAHEIKNPLSSMKVFAQLLPLKIDDPEYRKKLEEVLPREIDRIDRIVESLLGFARGAAPAFAAAKLESILDETLKYFADQAAAAGVRFKTNYAPLPEIEVDREQIARVFSNLLLNALQALPEGGEITVTTAPGKKVEELLQTVKIKVADTGHGMPAEMLKKLFDPFFTTKYGGTGLGLTIAHSVVDGHKGFIDVESKVGKGTTFTVTLPTHQ
ncbi:MAG: PAS domain S-box protein [Candidatus Saganbacteria bacterium]|nr:PAS domain S-box protein [Candidatus Saganbacteria bacterium]